ncbi:unnamed protein product [Symbiodinium necroappetens]|uniref:Sushi, von Willebrand factor type A, EGF and pentraxin domain-containing protein 1 n=1 Tax=Symbiodinium necroappetens TaxID=1628268 RepID=A0A812V8T2_9DINO|nr:unnamed protein product [Symbiodinium necroappetens]
MPGRGWLLLEVVASLLVASDSFNRQLQCSRDWNASNVVPLCLPCVVPEGIDTCMYDFSGCGFLPSGSICEIHCKAPYLGNSTIARCASNNLQEGLPLEWTAPWCSFSDCPYPTELPQGYVRDAQGDVHCADGYKGRPVRRCNTDPQDDCAIRPADLVGCDLIVGCRFTEEQDCQRLASWQEGLEMAPGEVCRAPCVEPFVGRGHELRCPADNTQPDREPDIGEVQCDLPCPPPDPLPYGYVNTSDIWECAPGYAGTAELICVFDGAPFCQRRVELQGCYPLMPCADLELPQDLAPDPCIYNLTECRGVLPGERCQLNCLPPFIDGGIPRFARCPGLNVNPFQELLFDELPRCIMACPDPPTLPEGYGREDLFGSSESQWRCDDGWVGQVNRTCLHFSNCSFQATMGRAGLTSKSVRRRNRSEGLAAMLRPKLQEEQSIDSSCAQSTAQQGTCHSALQARCEGTF